MNDVVALVLAVVVVVQTVAIAGLTWRTAAHNRHLMEVLASGDWRIFQAEQRAAEMPKVRRPRIESDGQQGEPVAARLPVRGA